MYFLQTSKTILLLKIVREKYCFIIDWFDRIYINSQIGRLIETLGKGQKINFKYSFLGRIAKIKEENNLVIFDNSKFVRGLLDIYEKLKYRLLNYSKTSVAMASMLEIKKELYFSPVKTGSIIVVIAILTNILLSILFHKEIGLLGWIMRILFLFISANGIFCNTDWQTIKNNSIVLKRFYR